MLKKLHKTTKSLGFIVNFANITNQNLTRQGEIIYPKMWTIMPIYSLKGSFHFWNKIEGQ